MTPARSQTLCIMIQRTTSSTLFPYTTLFRSSSGREKHYGTALLGADRLEEMIGELETPTLEPFRNPPGYERRPASVEGQRTDRKSTRLNSSHQIISYAFF